MNGLFLLLSFLYLPFLSGRVGENQGFQPHICSSSAFEVESAEDLSLFSMKKHSNKERVSQTGAFDSSQTDSNKKIEMDTQDSCRKDGGLFGGFFSEWGADEPGNHHLVVDVLAMNGTLEPYQTASLTQIPQTAKKPAQVREITSIEELKVELEASQGPVYVDCYGSYCPPCRMLAPHYDQFAKQLSGKGVFLKINLTAATADFMKFYHIQSVPTLLVFEKEQEIDRKVSLPEIMQYFEKLLDKESLAKRDAE